MYSNSKAAGRFSFLLNPAGIVIGYILTLFAIVAGAGAFPFSKIWMALLFVVVGAFFVVAVPVLVMVYLFFTWKIFTVLRGVSLVGSASGQFARLSGRGSANRPTSGKTWNAREPTPGFRISGSMGLVNYLIDHTMEKR